MGSIYPSRMQEVLYNHSHNDCGLSILPQLHGVWCVVAGADKICLAPMQQTSGTVGCHDYYCCYCCCCYGLRPWAPCESEMAELCSPTFNGLQLLGSLWERSSCAWLSCLHEWLREWKASGREPRADVVIPWNEHKAWLCPSVFYLPVFANSAHSNLLSWAFMSCWARSMSHLGGLEAGNVATVCNHRIVIQWVKCWHYVYNVGRQAEQTGAAPSLVWSGDKKILGCMQAFTEINYFCCFLVEIRKNKMQWKRQN